MSSRGARNFKEFKNRKKQTYVDVKEVRMNPCTPTVCMHPLRIWYSYLCTLPVS